MPPPPKSTVPPPAILAATSHVGDRWSLPIIDALMAGNHRFGQLLGALPGLAPNILSRRLAKLEATGLVVSRAYQKSPPRFAYEPTARAVALGPAIEALAAWAADGDGTVAPRPPVDDDLHWL